MALLFVDGFDHYATADVGKKYSASSINSISAGTGRRSTASLRFTTNAHYVQRAFTSAQTIVFGFAWTSTTAASATGVICGLLDSGTSHISITLDGSGRIQVRRGGSTGTILNTSTNALSNSVSYYIECKLKIDDSTGTYEVRVNGVNWVSGSSADTRNGATATANTVQLGSNGAGVAGTNDFDDFYICDTSGSTNTDFLGDCRVDVLFPNADGTYTSFTPSTGTDHYALLDEATPNTSDYVSSSTAGHQDSWQMGNLSALTGTIYGVQASVASLKDDAGARSLKVGVRSSTTNSLSSAQALSTSQVYYAKIQETDPATAAAWTESGVNAAQVVVENV